MATTPATADFLEFAWVWNAAQGQGTPAVHRRIARWLQARRDGGDRRLLLMAFRGCGKSTMVGLYCAWRLLREPDARILVLAADHDLAVKMVATVRRVLERHPLCRALLPDQPESWAMDRFTVRRRAVLRDPSMLAQGLSGNITGARADIIVCDDVEVAGNCDTPGKRAELRERLAETEFVLTPGGTILYVGTPHCADTLYLPPGHPDASLDGYRRLVSGGGFWDPAYGRPGSGDASVLAATYADGEGNHYLHRLSYLTHDPDDPVDPATQQCRAVAALARELLLPSVRVETNGIGRFLPAMLRREMAMAGAPCAVVEHNSRQAKTLRILGALEPALAARRLHAHEAVFRTSFPAEMAGWRPDAPNGVRDDGLDALAGCLLAEPVRLPLVPSTPRMAMAWRGG